MSLAEFVNAAEQGTAFLPETLDQSEPMKTAVSSNNYIKPHFPMKLTQVPRLAVASTLACFLKVKGYNELITHFSGMVVTEDAGFVGWHARRPHLGRPNRDSVAVKDGRIHYIPFREKFSALSTVP